VTAAEVCPQKRKPALDAAASQAVDVASVELARGLTTALAGRDRPSIPFNVLCQCQDVARGRERPSGEGAYYELTIFRGLQGRANFRSI
jgi:hypothetical protein